MYIVGLTPISLPRFYSTGISSKSQRFSLQNYLASGKMVEIFDFKISTHLRILLDQERNDIKLEWIKRTISDPDITKEVLKSEIRFWKGIPEFGGRFLRVVVNPEAKKIITAFFDRRFKL